MAGDFTSYEFVEGRTYALVVGQPEEAVRIEHHTVVGIEPQDRYETLEYEGPIGSGPWRKFRDWESEAEITINAHHILEVEEAD